MASNHAELNEWVEECAAMCQPDKVYWCDGSAEERKALEAEAFSTGELIELDQDKLPGCVYHRTALNDVARTENLTFICMDNQDDASPINNWMTREEGYKKAGEIFSGSMKGRTMYVIPFAMGPIGGPITKYGVELTDSIYVVLNMRIMTRMGQEVLDHLGTDGEFTKCLHGKAERDIERRLILHFPEDNTIWSVGSGYGGNVLLGKKCLALRIASYLGKQEGWMAEHMLILGIEDPDGNVTYIAGAFPSACGKTNLAMLVPPEEFARKGYKIWTVGDDIAWMKVGPDGRLWAINPENGMFGVAPGTSMKTNPNMMKAIDRDTIFTNVALKDDRTIWWEGHDDPMPEECTDWTGKHWKKGQTDEEGKPVPAANPNSRFTVPVKNCPVVDPKFEDPQGVPISAFIFGGRRAHLAPLVYEATGWQHGTFVASTMASERTAAQYGKQGEVRRDPMAMRPFIGYNAGDYLRHWLEIGKKVSSPPKIFHVNWFQQDEKGDFIWPGFGENLRVLEWIVRRCKEEAEAVETPIGNMPKVDDINLNGIDFSTEELENLLQVHTKEWELECDLIEEFYASIGERMPQELKEELAALRKRLQA